MVKFIVKRILYMLATLFVIITLTFMAMKAIPGDPIAAKYDKASPEVRARIEAIYDLDEPIPTQFVIYMGNVIKGNLGLSITQPSKTVNDIIGETFPASARLGTISLVIGLVFGIACGIKSGMRVNSASDVLITVVATLGISIPNFVVASALQYFLTYQFPILPAIGWDSKAGFLAVDSYVILPALALSFGTMGVYTKYMRESVSEVLQEDYVLLAEAKGLPELKIRMSYVLRNAILPIITVSAQQVAMLLTGSVVVESIFSIPGIGKYFVSSVTQRDYTLIMGVTIFYSLIFMIATLMMDILYRVADPRMELD